MSVPLLSFLVPRNNNTFYLLEDIYLKGGLRVVASNVERDSLNPTTKKAGMLVITKDTRKTWMLGDDLTSWTEYATGGGGGLGARQHTQIITPMLDTNGTHNFSLPMGNSCVIFNLSVDGPCEVRAFSDPSRSEPNPFTFIAVTNHLSDDGSTLLSDGSTIYGRRYTILMNLVDPPDGNIYWSLKNTQSTSAMISANFSYLPLD